MWRWPGCARLRSMWSGEVVRPGAYEISSLATISNALYAACGPARTGSLRQIKLVRDNQVVAEWISINSSWLGDRRHDAETSGGRRHRCASARADCRSQRGGETRRDLRAQPRNAVGRSSPVGWWCDSVRQSSALSIAPARSGQRPDHDRY